MTEVERLIRPLSPSPRKAWIETSALMSFFTTYSSPSPRKAWIETPEDRGEGGCAMVAFPPEGVD